MEVMKFKLGNISDISTGLVLKRKQADVHNLVKKYRLLTIKSIEEEGWINSNELEEFFSAEELNSRYLTQKGDIVIRLSYPNTAVAIDKSNEGLVISSLFAYIRLETDLLSPKYLSILINSEKLRGFFEQNSYGSALRTIKTKDLKELSVKVPSMKEQNRIIELYSKILEEKVLLRELIKEKNDYHKELINMMLEGDI